VAHPSDSVRELTDNDNCRSHARKGDAMRHVVALLVVVACATVLVGCSSESPVRPTPASDQPIRGVGFGAITSGGPTTGPIVDLAACLRAAPLSNCILAARVNALGTAAGVSAPNAPSNLVASAVGSSV